MRLHLPSLRERREDIALLASHFLGRYRDSNRKEIEGFSRLVLHIDNIPKCGL